MSKTYFCKHEHYSNKGRHTMKSDSIFLHSGAIAIMLGSFQVLEQHFKTTFPPFYSRATFYKRNISCFQPSKPVRLSRSAACCMFVCNTPGRRSAEAGGAEEVAEGAQEMMGGGGGADVRVRVDGTRPMWTVHNRRPPTLRLWPCLHQC